jgi:hypothetical protein
MNKGKFVMKKFLKISIVTIFLFAGCAQNQTNVQKANPTSDIKLLKNYGINEDCLIFYKGYFYFSKIEPNGISVNKLDKNYHLIAKKIIKILIEPKKYLIKNDHFYIFGYDNVKQKPVILDVSLKNLKLIKSVYLGKKYSMPADFFVDKDIYSAINVFNEKTKSDIYIYKNTSIFSKIASNKKESANFILPFDNKILVVGTISFINDDILIVLINKNGKILNARRIDLGMDDYVNKIDIKNDNIIIYAVSTDNMGAETDYTLILDKNLNIIKSKKNLEFKELPIKFRT